MQEHSASARVLLAEPIAVERFETTAEALSAWRRAVASKPALLLLSNDPHLQPVPEELRSASASLLDSAAPEQFAQATTDRSADPVLLPGMAVDAALGNAWFGELVWCFPRLDTAQELDLQLFKDQLIRAGVASSHEAETLFLDGNAFSGQMRGIPFTATDLASLEEISQPVVVHIDLGYFQPLYKNEISTPLLEIIYKTFATLRDRKLAALAVTFSYGHRDAGIALDVRFIGDIVAHLVGDPAQLGQPVPVNWLRQKNALYLSNFFQNQEILKLFRQQEQDAPNEAWIKFNLYRSLKFAKEADLAMASLAQAVAIDPVYAMEYLELSGQAYQSGELGEAIRLLSLARAALPDDISIELQLAQYANEAGNKDEALQRLDDLRARHWSAVYYAQVPDYLDELAQAVRINATAPAQNGAPTQDPPEARHLSDQSTEPARQRILHDHKKAEP